MARLFGMMGNRGDLATRVLAHEAPVLRVKSVGSPLGWGVGFYQGGEVLMRRRPIDEQPEIDITKVVGDIRADLLLGHVRAPSVGGLRTENTHPFRYRQWLFAQTGTTNGFHQLRERMAESVPPFLRSGIRGETDSEIIFHLFLSFLHDRGLLSEAQVEPAAVSSALRGCLALVDSMVAEVGEAPTATNIMISDGEFIFALHRGKRMAHCTFQGRADADALIGDDLQLRRRTPDASGLHVVLLASDFDDESKVTAVGSRWKALSEHAIVTLSRGAPPKIEAL
jgi:predicted glutamine amidotransferase